MSLVTAPLRELLKEENMFQWREDIEGKCFNEVKEILSAPLVLKYFDPDQDQRLRLMQGGQPSAYVSRSLTSTEQQYAQIEKKMLSIVYGTEKFEQYVYGRRVKVETDHKPIESIMKKNLLSAPKITADDALFAKVSTRCDLQERIADASGGYVQSSVYERKHQTTRAFRVSISYQERHRERSRKHRYGL